MKKRFFYIISFLLIFCIEVLIALYVRDNFIRPYVGDMLVVVLVYSFVRIFLPTGIPRMSFYVFLFCLFCGSAAILPVGGNIGDHEPCSQNHSGLYVRLGGHSLLCGRLCVYCFIRAYWQELIAMRHTFFVFRLIGLKVLSFHVPEPYYIVLAY